jgi:uncharacterized protein
MTTSKTILIAGGSGFIGTALSNELIAQGYRVIILSRKAINADKQSNPAYYGWDSDFTGIGKIDAVVNLAGDNIGQGPWTSEKKQRIRESRTESIIRLSKLLKQNNLKPGIWIQASAVGFYGHKTSGLIFENSPQGDGFLATVVNELEKTFKLNCPTEIKPVILRLGVVLHRDGGLMKQILQTAPLKFIGCPGDGRQKLSWIALEDLIQLFIQVIQNPPDSPVIDAVSPTPVSMGDLCKIAARKTNAWLVVKIPKFLLRLAFGAQKANELILADQTVESKILKEISFKFDYPTVNDLKF